MKYRLTIQYDQDVESPCSWDGSWKFYSFNKDHNNYRNPYDFLKIKNDDRIVVGANIGIQRKLDVGTAFFVSCYEHSGIIYSLIGEGPQCQWDTSQYAGILVWEKQVRNLGPMSYEDRQADARAFLKEYNDWANGQCFYYSIEKKKSWLIDSCGGYIGADNLKSVLKSEHPELFAEGVELELIGDAKWILE